MRNGILWLALAWIMLLLPICLSQASKSALKADDGDGGSGDLFTNDIEKVNPLTPDDTESSGDDEDGPDTDGGSGGGSGVEDGSGSGENPIVNRTASYKTDMPLKTTTMVDTINDLDLNREITKGPTTETTTKIKDGFIVTTLRNTDVDQLDQNENYTVIITPGDSKSLPSMGEEEEEDDNRGINFTVAIIVGVVVGAMLSILIIVCLVYRLRKKDEGSYCLDEPSTVMLRNDTDSPPPKENGTKSDSPY